MARRKYLYHRSQQVDLAIVDLAFEGKGIAKVPTENGDFVVFIPNTLPGQTVRCKMVKVKKAYAEARLIEVLEASAEEQPLDYHPIPGAPYINLPIERQAFYKRKTSIELFRRIGKIDKAEELLDQYIESPRIFHYRNKMEYSFAAVRAIPGDDRFRDDFALGFKRRGQWLAVENLEGDSGIFDSQLENFLPKLAQFFTDRNLSAWHGKKHSGFCRMLAVRKSYVDDQLLINFMSSSAEIESFDSKAFTQLFLEEFGGRLAGLIHTVNDDISDRPKSTEGKRNILHGEETIREQICGLSFNISMESFFQTNPASAEQLYQKALDYVFEKEIEDKPLILDLFAGTGTITQLLAQRASHSKVIGVEIVEEAVQDAWKNAQANGIENLDFYANDVGKFLIENPEHAGKINTLTLDPPRAGIAPKTLRKIIRLNAERIVYISCNPATQARDMQTLAEHGYELKKYSLVDQFPHTAHIESVALFELNR